MSDIEIARQAKTQPIAEIAKKLDIPESALIPFGRTKAKIDPERLLRGYQSSQSILTTYY